MKIKKKYLIIIPARKLSKRVKNKNIKLLNKKPLYVWTLKELNKIKKKYDCVISSDSEQIIQGAKKMGFNSIKRPKKLATDNSKIIDTIKYLLNIYKKRNIFYENIILLQVTSPLRKINDIFKSIKIFEKTKCDTLFSVFQLVEKYNQNIFFLENKKKFLAKKKVRNLSKIFIMNGPAILISKAANIYRNKLYGKKISHFKMPYERSIDINYNYELKMCEKLL